MGSIEGTEPSPSTPSYMGSTEGPEASPNENAVKASTFFRPVVIDVEVLLSQAELFN